MKDATLVAECDGIHNLIQIALNGRLWELIVDWQSMHVRLQIRRYKFEQKNHLHGIDQDILHLNDVRMVLDFFQQ